MALELERFGCGNQAVSQNGAREQDGCRSRTSRARRRDNSSQLRFTIPERWHDVTVTGGDVAFPCHKSLLAALSGYVRFMFRDDFTEGQASHVTLPEWLMVGGGIFYVHKWMYREELNLSLDIFEYNLPSAFYLHMDKTVDMLTDSMRYHYSRGVPVSRMFDHLSLAHSCGLPAVRDITLDGMARNFDEVANTEQLLALQSDDLLILIRNRQLQARSEDIVFSVAFAWLHHSDDRLTYLHDIVKSLRVGLVSAGTMRKALIIQILCINSECCGFFWIHLDSSGCSGKNLALAKTGSIFPQPQIPEFYMGIWRNVYVTLGDTCPDSTDVTVMIKGEAFRCHKAVLCGWSGYFERRFLYGEGIARLDESPIGETLYVPMSYEDDLPSGAQGEAQPCVGVHGASSSLSTDTETGPSTRVEEDSVDWNSKDRLPVPEKLICPSPAQAHDQHQDASDMKRVSLQRCIGLDLER